MNLRSPSPQDLHSESDLRPYCGEEMERLRYVGRSHVRHTFGEDRGGRTYRFNRLGFRGAEADPSTPHRVFVFGESHAFGYFVEEDEAWPSRFVERWCAHHRLERTSVNLLNFADPGSSNASIARMLISQCSALRPDLVLIHFADIRRSEVLLDGRPHRIGPWLLDDASTRAARNAPGKLPQTLTELIERGKAYFRHSLGPSGPSGQWQGIDATCILEALREILLVQSFCRAEGIPLVATCEHMEELRALRPETDPILEPLVNALDRKVLCEFGIWSTDDTASGPAERTSEHAEPSRHEAFARSLFDFYLLGHPDATPVSTRQPPAESRPRFDVVREFYGTLPFNHFGDVESAAKSLRDNPVPEAYPDLHRLLIGGTIRRVIDCGCGTGWLANCLALHYNVEVVGLDFANKALERARHVAQLLGITERVSFVEQDLLAASYDGDFDLLVSLGVLHHAPDPRRAFDHVRAWAPYLYIGLYHQPGRQPFLAHFRDLLETQGQEAALEELRAFGVGADEEHLTSWFRDQVLHPRETSHTLREILRWLDSAELELVSTSINDFRPIRRPARLLRVEDTMEERSRRALRQRRYSPGFFSFLAQRMERAKRFPYARSLSSQG